VVPNLAERTVTAPTRAWPRSARSTDGLAWWPPRAAHTLGAAMIEVRDDMIRQVAGARAAKIWRRPRYARHW